MASSLHYLFLTWPGNGNHPPALSMAQSLTRQGHRVTFVGYAMQRAVFESNGFSFVVFPQSSAALMGLVLGTPDSMRGYMDAVFASSHHLTEVPQLIQQQQADRLTVDCSLAGALAAVEKGYVSVPSAVYQHSAITVRTTVEKMYLPFINDMRAKAGLPPITSFYTAMMTLADIGVPVLVASIVELEQEQWRKELDQAALAGKVRYLGPLRTHPSVRIHVDASIEFATPASVDGFDSVAHSWRSRLPWPLSQADDAQQRPLVLVSFSTVPPIVPAVSPDQVTRYQRTIEALADQSKYRVICTFTASSNIETVPAHIVWLPYVPHDFLLPYAAVVVTHAGHGTLTAALSYGVPCVCLPNYFDQPVLSARVEAMKAGIKLDGANATAGDIRQAVDTALSDAEYTKNAGVLKTAIQKALSAVEPLIV